MWANLSDDKFEWVWISTEWIWKVLSKLRWTKPSSEATDTIRNKSLDIIDTPIPLLIEKINSLSIEDKETSIGLLEKEIHNALGVSSIEIKNVPHLDIFLSILKETLEKYWSISNWKPLDYLINQYQDSKRKSKIHIEK